MSEKKHRGLIVLKVQGTSMLPTLNPGSWVIVRWGKEPKRSDVVVARSPLDNQLIIKRLVKIESDGYWLEGDAMRTSTALSSQDSWVFGALTREQILGVVIWSCGKR